MAKFFMWSLSLLFICCKPPSNKQFSQKALLSPIINLKGEQIYFKNIIANNKGKTIVIDVWASWCGDCIKGLPKLKTIQKKYPKAKYVFISLDRNQKAWKRGVARYQIQGTHYYVKGGWKSTFAKNIDLDWIPRYMIVNPMGKVMVYRAIKADDANMVSALEKLNI